MGEGFWAESILAVVEWETSERSFHWTSLAMSRKHCYLEEGDYTVTENADSGSMAGVPRMSLITLQQVWVPSFLPSLSAQPEGFRCMVGGCKHWLPMKENG
jgi:hypothetical protein